MLVVSAPENNRDLCGVKIGVEVDLDISRQKIAYIRNWANSEPWFVYIYCISWNTKPPR